MLKKLLFSCFCFGMALTAAAQTAVETSDAPETAETYVKIPKTYRYRVYFTDKKENIYSTKRPQEFLSEKALARRKKYGIKVDEHDLPVTPLYLEFLRRKDMKVLHVSKWNNTAVVETADTAQALQLHSAKFISNVVKVWESKDSMRVKPQVDRRKMVFDSRDTLDNYYGHALQQVSMLGVDNLHQAGFRGENITIAVVDGGFLNADHLAGLRNCNILGTKNFVGNGEASVYEAQSHGTMVLSCIAADMPNALVGTAPRASFYLLQSEDNDCESLVEEDNWCAALEYADSLGVDILTSSLGYYGFDDASTSHKYHELDGRTAVNSRAASLAASRGILVLNSAGNSGNDPWKKIGFPADAYDILTVGALTPKLKNANFSSLGNTADGRVKPDVMALGQTAWMLDETGSITVANGTSFSTPILCGGVACLMQACPDARPVEIIRAVQQAGDNAGHPDNVYGYGVPNLWKAYQALTKKK